MDRTWLICFLGRTLWLNILNYYLVYFEWKHTGIQKAGSETHLHCDRMLLRDWQPPISSSKCNMTIWSVFIKHFLLVIQNPKDKRHITTSLTESTAGSPFFPTPSPGSIMTPPSHLGRCTTRWSSGTGGVKKTVLFGGNRKQLKFDVEMMFIFMNVQEKNWLFLDHWLDDSVIRQPNDSWKHCQLNRPTERLRFNITTSYRYLPKWWTTITVAHLKTFPRKPQTTTI